MELFNRNFGLQWHITNQCDQRCKHCYIWGGGRSFKEHYKKELDLEKCKSIVNKFIEFCKVFEVDPIIAITGGDPLLFKWIWGLLEYFNQRNLSFIILGNPFHLDDVICERLRDLGCRAYQMSLDGVEQTHDVIRKKGSFESTIKAIKILQGVGIKTMIMSTISRFNYRDIPELIKKLVVDYRVDVYDFARYSPALKDGGQMLSPNEYRQFLSDAWGLYTDYMNYKTKFPLKDHLWRLFLYEKGLFQIRKENIVFQGCGCGIRHLTLLPNGIVYACRRFKSPIGNILTQSFKDIFLGQKLERYRKIKHLEGCKNCELLNYCRGCHAVSYGAFGDFFAKDPQCWRLDGSVK